MSLAATTPVLPTPAPAPVSGAQGATEHGASPGAEPSRPRVLSIAGTDPTGGAGIQADLKAFAAHGAYGMAVTTALVAQNTHGVRTVHVPGADFLIEQLDAVSDDVTIDAVKIGMVADEPNARAIAAWLRRVQPPFVVLDPVMVATSGHRLLDEGAEQAVRELVVLADLVTPNLPELAVLVGEQAATTWPDALAQARRLHAASGAVVLLKGGHLTGEESPDALVGARGPDDVTTFSAPRVDTVHTHGTGCSLSAAVAALRPRRDGWESATRDAKTWLTGALRAGGALAVGTGRGPVDHLAHLPTLGRQAFSEEAWERIEGWREAVESMGFVRALADGSLAVEDFGFYLAQDAAYLAEYSRVLSRASQLAPTPEARQFFAGAAVESLEVEQALHRDWLGEHAGMDRGAVESVDPSPVTAAYTNHLHAASNGSYAETVAALLPCYWLYSYIGDVLVRRAGDLDGHPYARWISLYGDPAFQEATRTACSFADEAARWASPAERERMLRAFELSSMHEYLFFEQGLTRPTWPEAPVGGAEK
ncbi:bifunctional hydroxymethylpyrimidine kinase/phosphomethylpyrimidine kinase [Oerskovia enterophila]|uniref:Hydroxymethylpyrimidine/phosphomethylpyrimidine kinase n=1 Tax=Oerskovia enterophila TaxID=43678 RepID=A0A163SYI8_9CELL|nr:bifunctional hydroxymethylpyrimidine kinase/phosphomethylpyrimidine kinase [Oerskovia enterophila]KZM36891.1 hydroxymethylpyrimidine/phosphomethylpyrimidine kinase [Oerskovia enterophila]